MPGSQTPTVDSAGARHEAGAVLTRYWRAVVGTVDHRAVNEKVHGDAGWNAHYLFMTVMSAGIAVLGLLLSSPAVVIGAMLVSPLMGPIIGLGFALATLDAHELRRAAVALGAGALLAVLFCAAIVLVSPLQNVTSELAARTRPNLFDLVVALFSALAGTYATIRGRSGTIVGVAIATALMPPLATVGFGLATLNGAVFSGALLLFVTNFVTIALTATVMARLYGFSATLSPQQTAIQSVAIIAVFVALAVPLGFSLRQLAWEGLANGAARSALSDTFKDGARISQVDLDYDAHPLKVTATVLTPRYRADAETVVRKALEGKLDRPVEVSIEQYRVGIGEADAAAANRAKEVAPAPVDVQAQALARDLALVAGVDPAQVLLDAEKRHAFVRAAPLPGAGIVTYRVLEARMAAASGGWQVELVPPSALLLPEDAAPTDAVWLAARRDMALEVSGSDAEAVMTAIEQAGGAVARGAERGPVRLRLVSKPLAVPVSLPSPTPSPTPRR